MSYIPKLRGGLQAEARRRATSAPSAASSTTRLTRPASPAATSPTTSTCCSAVLGVSTNWNIGAFSIGGQVSYGVNEGAVQGWYHRLQQPHHQPALSQGRRRRHRRRLHAAGLPGCGPEVHGHPAFEAGIGDRQDNADGAPGFSQKDEVWVTYAAGPDHHGPGRLPCPGSRLLRLHGQRRRRRPGLAVVRRCQVADRFLI